jgi:hypothetical protein
LDTFFCQDGLGTIIRKVEKFKQVRVSAGPNSMKRNTVENTMEFMGLNESTATTWRAGRRQMMIDTTAALGDGLLIGKDAAVRERTRLSFSAEDLPTYVAIYASL